MQLPGRARRSKMPRWGPIKRGTVMVLQFLVGCIVSVINIMIHAMVTAGAIGIVSSAGLRHTERPRLQLRFGMEGTCVALMVAQTLEVFVWPVADVIVCVAPAGSDLL